MKRCDMYPVDDLIADFRGCLEYFAKKTPVNSEYSDYLDTVRLRIRLGSTASAIKSDEFLERLHHTMDGFFGFAQRKILVSPEELKAEVREHAQLIEAFDGEKLGADQNETGNKLWELINKLKLTTNKRKERVDPLRALINQLKETADVEKKEGDKLWTQINQLKEMAAKGEKKGKEDKSKLVSGSKALHLLLPDLVVPIDRRYTSTFLYRYSDEFDRDNERQTFGIAFAAFRKIAKAVNPEAYVGTQKVHANPTKVIDNGIIGFVERSRAKFQDAVAETQTREIAYSLYEKRGRVDRDDLKDWFEAEAIVRKRGKLAA
jgi:hypothetical protein